MGVEFKDYSIEVKEALDDTALAFLYEAAELLTAQVKKNTKVRTGQLKGSWNSKVDQGKMEAKVGSGLERSLYYEFGTGEYAANGDGRKGGWWYKDKKGNWIHTKGMYPRRPLQSAFSSTKGDIIRRANDLFKKL